MFIFHGQILLKYSVWSAMLIVLSLPVTMWVKNYNLTLLFYKESNVEDCSEIILLCVFQY